MNLKKSRMKSPNHHRQLDPPWRTPLLYLKSFIFGAISILTSASVETAELDVFGAEMNVGLLQWKSRKGGQSDGAISFGLVLFDFVK